MNIEMQSEEYSVVHFLAQLWTRKRPIIAMGVLVAVLSGAQVLLHPKPHHVQALLRIESQTGTPDNKDVSLEAETHYLSSRSMVDLAIEKLGPRVDILAGNGFLQRWLSAHFRAQESYKFPIQYDGLVLEEFVVPRSLQNVRLTMLVGEHGSYQLIDRTGKILFNGEQIHGALVPMQSTLTDTQGADSIHIAVSHLTAVPGTTYTIISHVSQSLIGNLQKHLKIEVVTRKENFGFIQVGFDSSDAGFAMQFMNALLAEYVRSAYDGSSVSKMQALAHMEEQLKVTEQELETAEAALAQFQEEHHTVDTSAETQFSMQRLLDVQTQLSHLRTRKMDDGAYHTAQDEAQIAMGRQIAQLEMEAEKVQTEINQLPETERQLYKLKRNIETLKQNFSQTSDKVTQLLNEVAGINAYAKVIDPPELVETASGGTGIVKLAIVGFLAGSAIGSVLVYYYYFSLFSWIRTAEQLESLTCLPLIGSVSRQKRTWSWFGLRRVAPQSRHFLSSFGEELTTIEHNMNFSISPDDNNIRLFTGCCRGQGVTMIATHMAAVHALKQKTILIDCNLFERNDNPYIAVPRSPGLSDALMDLRRLPEAIRQTEVKNLWFLPTGTYTSYGTQLLNRASFTQLLQALSAMYECVIVSYPGIHDHENFETNVRLAGSVFFVVRARKNVEHLKQFLLRYGHLKNVKGSILNCAPRRKAR